jgi:hypothetical protein
MLIKLNDKGARVYMSSRYRRLNPLDWQSRTGRVAKYSPDRTIAYVLWGERRSFDRVSVDLIEPATLKEIDQFAGCEGHQRSLLSHKA